LTDLPGFKLKQTMTKDESMNSTYFTKTKSMTKVNAILTIIK